MIFFPILSGLCVSFYRQTQKQNPPRATKRLLSAVLLISNDLKNKYEKTIQLSRIAWKYPKEWVKITTAYPEFAAWAGGDDTASGWYTHPSSSNVY